MKFWLFMDKLDRRWLFLAIGLSVIIPSITNMRFPVTTTPPTLNLWNFVDSLKYTKKPLIIICDYSPSTSPELQPMAHALFRHALEADIPVFLYGGLYTEGFGLARIAEETVLEEIDYQKANGDSVIYGEDYVFLPFVPGGLAVIAGMGEDFIGTFRVDARGDSLKNLPMMDNVRRLEDIGLIVDIAGSAVSRTWMVYAGTRYGTPVGVGTTAVSAAEYYTFLQTRQFVGMMGGMKGAAEYEELNASNLNIEVRKQAGIAMASQNFVHLLIIFMVILGNISFFVLKRNKERRL
ncbi:hypothetical protein JW890_01910 [candidate division WOR-3 bacterium]|nr:hypothetical protein [candidate division WOR-3 bacterium]